MRILPVGERALLVELDDQQQVLDLYTEIQRRLEIDWLGPRPADVVPGARTVLLDGLADPAQLAAEIPTWSVPRARALPAGIVECHTVYDGPDLEYVAQCWGMSVREAVAAHTATLFYVAFCGFAPGFGYLAGLAPDLVVPRRGSPRSSVPAGSVAVAGEYSAIYPRDSPGGWQLIGRTKLVLWDAQRRPPALLRPGVQVRFLETAG